MNCLTDLEKARAIFRWITFNDLNVMEFDQTLDKESPMGLLRGIKFGTETYTTLFKRLCRFIQFLYSIYFNKFANKFHFICSMERIVVGI